MADKPILFSAPMVKSLLAGTKTQTRRAMFKKEPPADGRRAKFHRITGKWEWRTKHDNFGGVVLPQPRIAVGDRLYVRESLTIKSNDQDVRWLGYAADGKDVWPLTQWTRGTKGIPSIHAPRWTSRITLTVTDVRVERLNAISDSDAVAEGTPCYVCGGPMDGQSEADCHCFHRKADATDYRNLWEAINGGGSWAANPWVAAYSFRVQMGNIDQLEAVHG